MRLKIDWVSLILGRKFTVFLCFTLHLRAILQVQAPQGAYIWRGDLTGVFCVMSLWGLYMEGFIFGILRYCSSYLTLINRCALQRNMSLSLLNHTGIFLILLKYRKQIP